VASSKGDAIEEELKDLETQFLFALRLRKVKPPVF
jgi:hypothetical protein